MYPNTKWNAEFWVGKIGSATFIIARSNCAQNELVFLPSPCIHSFRKGELQYEHIVYEGKTVMLRECQQMHVKSEDCSEL